MVYLTTDQRAMDQVPAEEKLPVKVKVPADTPGLMMVGEMEEIWQMKEKVRTPIVVEQIRNLLSPDGQSAMDGAVLTTRRNSLIVAGGPSAM
jgi:hypothetical protein